MAHIPAVIFLHRLRRGSVMTIKSPGSMCSRFLPNTSGWGEEQKTLRDKLLKERDWLSSQVESLKKERERLQGKWKS